MMPCIITIKIRDIVHLDHDEKKENVIVRGSYKPEDLIKMVEGLLT